MDRLRASSARRLPQSGATELDGCRSASARTRDGAGGRKGQPRRSGRHPPLRPAARLVRLVAGRPTTTPGLAQESPFVLRAGPGARPLAAAQRRNGQISMRSIARRHTASTRRCRHGRTGLPSRATTRSVGLLRIFIPPRLCTQSVPRRVRHGTDPAFAAGRRALWSPGSSTSPYEEPARSCRASRPPHRGRPDPASGVRPAAVDISHL